MWLRSHPAYITSSMPASASDYCCRPRIDCLLYQRTDFVINARSGHQHMESKSIVISHAQLHQTAITSNFHSDLNIIINAYQVTSYNMILLHVSAYCILCTCETMWYGFVTSELWPYKYTEVKLLKMEPLHNFLISDNYQSSQLATYDNSSTFVAFTFIQCVSSSEVIEYRGPHIHSDL